MATTSSSSAIGIDLGTTFSCVAVAFEGRDRLEVIANNHGNRTTPSYVGFHENEWLVGEEAKALVAVDPQNTIFNIKRLLGRRFNDPVVQEDLAKWPFRVINDAGAIKIQVESEKGLKLTFSPEELCAKIIKRMKETAETFLGTTVKEAVITVPAYFDNAQREATRKAGQLAGLTVQRIFNEPTSAAVAYGKDLTGNKKILVFDFGGGTLDVSILRVTNGKSFNVLTTSGDMHLGGEDIDQLIIDHLVKEFLVQHEVDLKQSAVAIQRLRKACEAAKRALSNVTSAKVALECIHKDIHLDIRFTREELETLCVSIFNKAMLPVKQALSSATLQEADIDQVVLTGGSSRIPKVQENLQRLFPGKPLCRSINPDEAVAIGAALQAQALITNNTTIEVIEGIPFSLGLSNGFAEYIKVLLPKNTPYPVTKTRKCGTTSDDQDSIELSIYEGERPMARDNHLLNCFKIEDLARRPAGHTQFDVTFAIDVDGILNVSAIDLHTKKKYSVRIDTAKHVDSEQTVQMLADLEINEKNDTLIRNNIKAMESLSAYVKAAKTSAHSNSKLKTAFGEVSHILDWMEDHKHEIVDRLLYDEKLQEAERHLGSYL